MSLAPRILEGTALSTSFFKEQWYIHVCQERNSSLIYLYMQIHIAFSLETLFQGNFLHAYADYNIYLTRLLIHIDTYICQDFCVVFAAFDFFQQLLSSETFSL